ncbi:MAG: tyrosine--tRNA ligase [Minisyncoccales bacterium]
MDINTDSRKIKEILERGVEEAIDKDSLAKKLSSGKRLRVKFGIDPTAADIHLGHCVALRKLRQFQDIGHQAILIIGDFTSLIGDPSGRTTSRPALTEAQIRDNMKDYIRQASKVIDIDKAEIHYNREWFGQKPMSFLMDLAGRFTVARLIEREDFQKRLKEGLDVSMLELLYPLLQGYDSVAVDADIELGGYDQRLNLLFGRKVQRAFGRPEQDVMTVPLLIGTDGAKKMSKSVGNYIKIDEAPVKMYEQLMAVQDLQIWEYLTLLTDAPQDEIQELKKEIESGKKHPKDAKMIMAKRVVEIYKGVEPSKAAEEEFVNITQKGKLPTDIPTIAIKEKTLDLPDLLVVLGAAKSKGQARRLAEQNGVKIDSQIKNNWKETIEIKPGMVVQVGKSKFFKVA